METRTIQKTGGASYTITLPKEWIKKLGLSEKDKLEIFQQKKNQLGIRPHTQRQLPKSSIFINRLNNKQIAREIIALYLTGINEINLYAEPITYEQRALVRDLSYLLIGFELFDVTTNSMIFKNVSNNVISTAEYISKMITIMLSMFADMQTAVLTNNKALARDVIERDIEIDRIQLIISRKFNIVLYTLLPIEDSDSNLAQTHCYEHIAIRLERISDHIVRMASAVTNPQINSSLILTKPEKDRISKLFKYLKICAEMVNNLDKRKANDVFEFYDSFGKSIFDKDTVANKTSSNIIIDDSIGRIRSYMKNIAEETLNYFAAKNIDVFQ